MQFEDDVSQPCTSIRVERGAKPKLQISQDKRTAYVTIPRETNTNWPKMEAEMTEGYSIYIQKCQEQFKIYVQHKKSRKPELVVYSSGLQYEKDIKTHLKEMNTNMNHVFVAGPNLDVSGSLKGNRVTLESTVGTIHVYAKMAVKWLDIHAQSIVVSTEARIATQTLTLISRRTQLDGHIYPLEEDSDMQITANCSLLHVGVDGCLGESVERPASKFFVIPKAARKITSKNLNLTALGSVANHGKIIAKEKLELSVAGSWLSLGDGSIDSATRGYEAFKKIKGIESRGSQQPSVSKMVEAIRGENASAVADLIEQGVDLQDKERGRTVKNTAIEEYKKSRQQRCKHRMKENYATISALMEIHEWRRGRVQAMLILAKVDGKCEDLAQFQAKRLEIKIGNTGCVERDSIWLCRDVKMEVQSDLLIEGQVKHRSLFVLSPAVINITQEAILFASQYANFRCQRFTNSGTLSLAHMTVIAADSASFSETSYSEANSVDIDCVGVCTLDGNAQISQLSILSHAHVVFPQSCKLISDSMHISANGMLCHGLVNSTSDCELLLSDSAHIFETAKFEAGDCSISSECHLVLDGTAIVERLESYIRQDLFISNSGKFIILDDGHITAGSLKNYCTVQAEKNLSVTLGTFEQGERGILFVKESLILIAFLPSDFVGRLLCGHLSLTCHRPCKFDGWLKANDMEVYLPNVADSSLLLSGQAYILNSPLCIKGNASTCSDFHSLSLLGTLSASAIIAPFQSVFVGADSYIRLGGLIPYDPSCDFSLLINCQRLLTTKESSIVSIGNPPGPEAIICSELLDHHGQIRFASSEAIILAANFTNKGMFSNVDGKNNHVRFLRLRISEKLENCGILSADELEIIGDGTLLNKNRIFAVEQMNIEMANFDNATGKIESKRGMTLLSGSDKEQHHSSWLKLNGHITASSHLHLKARNLHVDLESSKKDSSMKKPESLILSATYELLLKSDIHDPRSGKLKCEAQHSISFANTVDINEFNITLGGLYSPNHIAKLIVNEKSSLKSEWFEIDTKTREIVVVIDGSVQFKRLRLTGDARRVVFTGNGTIDGFELEAQNCEIRWEMAHLPLQTVKSRGFVAVKDKVIRIVSLKLNVDDFNLEGTLTIKQLLQLTGGRRNLNFNGAILGMDSDSELTVDGPSMSFSNSKVANFGFVELNAKENLIMEQSEMKHCDTIVVDCSKFVSQQVLIENAKRLAISCTQMSFDGTANKVENVIVNSDSEIDFNVNLTKSRLISVQSRGKLTCQGNIGADDRIEFEAKWVQLEDGLSITTKELAVDSLALLNRADIRCDKLQATSLYSIVNSNRIHADSLSLCSPIVVSPNSSTISCKSAECPSILLVTADHLKSLTDHTLVIELVDLTGTPTSLASQEVNSWKETVAFLKEKFQIIKKSGKEDDFINSFKHLDGMKSTKIVVTKDGRMQEELLNLCSDKTMTADCINVNEIIAIVDDGIKLMRIDGHLNQYDSRKSKAHVGGSKLISMLSRFRNLVHVKETQRESSEDVGYESRGSSDEMDEQKVSDVDAFDSSYHSSILDQIPEEIETPSTSEEEEHVPENRNEELKTRIVIESSDDEADDSAISECEPELERREEIRRDYVICRGETIGLARLKRWDIKRKNSKCLNDKKKSVTSYVPDSHDLVLKRLKMKEALSSYELRSYGSQASLFSMDMSQFDDNESTTHSTASPFSRSRIPQSSFRSPTKPSLVNSPRRTPVPPSPVLQF